MSELWGFQSGQSQGQQDQQSKGLYELRMAEGAIDIQTKQLTYQNAALMQKRQESAIRLMQMATSKQGSTNPNPTADISNTLMTLGQIDIESGLPEQGLAAIKSASTLQANHSKIVQQTTNDQIRRFSFLSNSLTEVHDQASWDQAKMIFQSNFPGELDPRIANKPYSPELIKQLAAGTSTALQKANKDLSIARAGEVAVNTDLARTRIPWVKSQTTLNQAREDQIRKNGGENALPKAAAVNQIKDLIVSEYPDIEKSDANQMALRVSMDAKKLIDKGMNPIQANKKAFNKAKEQGIFFGLKEGHVKAGSSTKNPLKIPLAGGKADMSNMTDNAIYDGAAVGHPGEFYAFDKARGGLVHIQPGDTSEDEPDDDGAED